MFFFKDLWHVINIQPYMFRVKVIFIHIHMLRIQTIKYRATNISLFTVFTEQFKQDKQNQFCYRKLQKNRNALQFGKKLG